MVCAPVWRDNPQALARGLLIIQSFSKGIIDRTGTQIMLYLTCTMIFCEDLAHYGVSRVKNWVSGDCGTIKLCTTFHRYPIFSKRYSVLCRVYTGYCGTSEIEHGLCACTVDSSRRSSLGEEIHLLWKQY